jgi:hypothetical protein
MPREQKQQKVRIRPVSGRAAPSLARTIEALRRLRDPDAVVPPGRPAQLR